MFSPIWHHVESRSVKSSWKVLINRVCLIISIHLCSSKAPFFGLFHSSCSMALIWMWRISRAQMTLRPLGGQCTNECSLICPFCPWTEQRWPRELQARVTATCQQPHWEAAELPSITLAALLQFLGTLVGSYCARSWPVTKGPMGSDGQAEKAEEWKARMCTLQC